MSETILQEAQRLVHGDRGESYGHPLDDYETTAALWSALLKDSLRKPLTAEQAVLCMVAVKLSRESRKHKRDNLTDAAGYSECVQMIHDERERRKGQTNGASKDLEPGAVVSLAGDPARAPSFRELMEEARKLEVED